MLDSSSSGQLAAKINQLFEAQESPAQRPISNAAAAEAITSSTGVPISAAYLWQLRTGRKRNPSIAHLRAIAEYFGVPAHTLLDDSGVGDESGRRTHRGLTADHNVLIHSSGPGGRWRITGVVSIEEDPPRNGHGGGGGDESPRSAGEAADAAAERATAAIADWVRAAERAAELEAREESSAGALETYLPEMKQVEVAASVAERAQRAIEELALRVVVVPAANGSNSTPK